MKAVVQRVAWGRVQVEGATVGEIGPGLVVLVAAHRDDGPAEAAQLADRVAGLRIFNDDSGKMNLSLRDAAVGGIPEILAVSNFTVYGETSKNRRPSFVQAAPYERARELFEAFVTELRARGCKVEQGIFGADMQVAMVNDGPVTVVAEVVPTGRDVV